MPKAGKGGWRRKSWNIFTQVFHFLLNKSSESGKNTTEVIKDEREVNQMLKDKLFLVMLVLGLLTMVAAAGS